MDPCNGNTSCTAVPFEDDLLSLPFFGLLGAVLYCSAVHGRQKAVFRLFYVLC